MKKELIALREKMIENNIDYYMVPTTDYHGSEYVNDYFKCREFISGFTGDAGTLVIGIDEAYLWTDGRFFLQAPMQLKDSGIELMKMGEPGVPTIFEYLKSRKTPFCLGFDGRLTSFSEGSEFETLPDVTIVWDKDLVDQIWTDRPEIVPSEIYSIPLEVTGRSPEEKLKEVRAKMADKAADHLLLTTLEEIAWLFNIRGSDIKYTPVFFAFALITRTKAELFISEGTLSYEAGRNLDFVKIRNYEEIYEALGNIPPLESLWINDKLANYALGKCIPDGIPVIREATPVELMKALKNSVEITSTINAHITDGIVMVNFLRWLKENNNKTDLSEMSVAGYLDDLRIKEGANDLSFTTIVGYGANGAIIHYEPVPETNKSLGAEGFILVDSGGQYDNGTTDITRTIALGHLTDKMKEYYTYVLKSHITLALQHFKAGTKGIELDVIARKPLREHGLDFNHGTGHGVGHLLCVHEDPNNISPRNGEAPIVPGMITSNEPGVYIENKFGIRLENEILCEELENGDYGFRTITLCPFEREAIVKELLTAEELEWLNDYHKAVFQVLSPLLDEETRRWLKSVTAEL